MEETGGAACLVVCTMFETPMFTSSGDVKEKAVGSLLLRTTYWLLG